MSRCVFGTLPYSDWMPSPIMLRRLSPFWGTLTQERLFR